MRRQKIFRDDRGATMVEFSIIMGAFFVVFFGLIEFSLALYQWNSATKAVQLGARLAAVSSPVWQELTEMSLVASGEVIGGTMTPYTTTCDGSSGACSCSGARCSEASGGPTYDLAAMNVIVYGREGDTSCGNVGDGGLLGMCDVFAPIGPANVTVKYENSGLGFVGHPAGAVPTITVTVTGMSYQFIFLSGFMDFGITSMPDFSETMTGEDMNIAAP